ncbi:A24 family peptidase [Trinickia acidisoli]|uniref:A24 family peptidase n=1 Tax=Trinickia acidisoli TaxID=2767482 RepID=UPI001A8C5A03|nr:prepilin peptidase [Trinickia acidisoli]
MVSNAIGYAGCALLLALAYTDLQARRLPNPLVAAFGALYVAHAWLGAVSYSAFAQHVVAALVVFVCGAALYVADRIGGGDVKLASALAFWIGPHGAVPALVFVSITGSVVAVAGLIADRLAPAAAPLPLIGSTLRLVSARRGVPYGVALAACGVIALLPRSFVIG